MVVSGTSELLSRAHAHKARRKGKASPSSQTRQATSPGQGLKKPEYVPGEMILKVDENASRSFLKSLTHQIGAASYEDITPRKTVQTASGRSIRVNQDGFEGKLLHVKLAPGVSAEEGIRQAVGKPGVYYAEPNYIYHLIEPVERRPLSRVRGPAPTPPSNEVVPNDPRFSQLWGLKNTGQNGGKAGADIKATDAWALSTGSRTPLVADIDTGVDYNHEDISGNTYTDPADGSHGRNVINDTNNPMDDNDHGTHTFGTIAAVGNNGKGVAGVNWQATVVAVKFLNGGGSGTLADAVKAIAWATEKGARLTSNSWGGGGFSQALYDVLKASPALHMFAAGNESNDNDRRPAYPASYDLPNIVAVAASDNKDELASFSNWGKTTVDLAAPGVAVVSTIPGNRYASFSGTSMATPHTTGVADLILSKFPNLTNAELKDRLINTVDPVPAFANKMVSGGRLNALSALQDDSVPPAAPGDFQSAQATALSITLTWTATGDDGTVGQAKAYDLRMSDRPIATGTPQEGEVAFEDATPVAVPAPQPAGSPETVKVSVPPDLNGKTYYFALKVIDKVGNRSPAVATQAVTQPASVVFNANANANDESLWTPQAPWAKEDEPDLGKVWSDSPGTAYDNNIDVSLTSIPMQLNTVKSPVLTFTEKHDTEKNFDYANVEVTSDGGTTWDQLLRMDGFSNWNTQRVDLTQYEGKTIQVRFRLTSDSSVTRDGWKIASVLVAGEPPPPPPPPPEPGKVAAGAKA